MHKTIICDDVLYAVSAVTALEDKHVPRVGEFFKVVALDAEPGELFRMWKVKAVLIQVKDTLDNV